MHPESPLRQRQCYPHGDARSSPGLLPFGVSHPSGLGSASRRHLPKRPPSAAQHHTCAMPRLLLASALPVGLSASPSLLGFNLTLSIPDNRVASVTFHHPSGLRLHGDCPLHSGSRLHGDFTVRFASRAAPPRPTEVNRHPATRTTTPTITRQRRVHPPATSTSPPKRPDFDHRSDSPCPTEAVQDCDFLRPVCSPESQRTRGLACLFRELPTPLGFMSLSFQA
jgi:hypothetical protein